MAQENQIHPRSDEEFAAIKPKLPREQRSSRCFVYLLAGIVLQSAVILVFALVVLRISTPDVELSSVTVKNLRYGNASSPLLNMALVAEMTVKNTNFGHFKFENGSASVLYGGTQVGETKLGNGRARARKTKRMNITVEVRSSWVPDTKNLSMDLDSKMLNLTSYAKINGKVHLMKVIKRKRISEMNCSMTLNLTNGTIQDLVCN